MVGPGGGDSGDDRAGQALRIGGCIALALGIAAASWVWRGEAVDHGAVDPVAAGRGEDTALAFRPGVIVLKVFGPVLY